MKMNDVVGAHHSRRSQGRKHRRLAVQVDEARSHVDPILTRSGLFKNLQEKLNFPPLSPTGCYLHAMKNLVFATARASYRFNVLTLLAVLTFLCLVCGHAFAAQRANVILIVADDFGYECVRANGGQSYATPHLDKLAKGGVRFTRCHVQPLCTPTRIMLMTGMSNVRNYTDFGEMEKSQTTFGHIMKEAGYATCIAGKWQLGRDLTLPKHFGFDEHCLWQLNRRPSRYKNPGLEINGKQKNFHNSEYGPDIVSDYALDFIRRNKDRPFFLYYPLMLTHAPFEPTPDSEDYAAYDGDAEKGDKKYFTDMVAYMDKLIGKLVAHVDKLGLRENTLILFLGDNGTAAGISSKFKGKQVMGGKGKTIARGTHVPAIANWPGQVVAGKVCDDLIDASDFLPSFCEMVDVKIPSTLKLDGRSFAPQLRGERGTPREWLYSWYQPRGPSARKAEFAHDKRVKLYATGEMFNIVKDPDERTPLRELKRNAKEARAKLQAAIDSFKGARPAAIAKQVGGGNSEE
jgi:arylsulfatase A